MENNTKSILEIQQKFADDLLQATKEFTERYVLLQTTATMEVLTAGGGMLDVIRIGQIANQVMSSITKELESVSKT